MRCSVDRCGNISLSYFRLFSLLEQKNYEDIPSAEILPTFNVVTYVLAKR